MLKIMLEMPSVSKCGIEKCAYNVNQNCHARAITVGDGANPSCDTFLVSDHHSKNIRRIAGVGACKVSFCKHNEDFECTAEKVEIGIQENKIQCLTFELHSGAY